MKEKDKKEAKELLVHLGMASDFRTFPNDRDLSLVESTGYNQLGKLLEKIYTDLSQFVGVTRNKELSKKFVRKIVEARKVMEEKE